MSSKSATKSVNHSIYQFMVRNKDSMSYQSRYDMTQRLVATAKDLHGLGYIVRHVKGFKSKHAEALISHWKAKELSVGTIKNRLADIRFVCGSLGRSNAIKSNEEYNVGSRLYRATDNKAILNTDFSKINDPYLKHSLELQRLFGLRREECIKIIPSLADKGDHLWLKGSWTKGKIERLIPIRTSEQREALNNAKLFANNDRSLIPELKTYIQQRYVYDRETREIGYKNLHGLRHAYAQTRYKELTGWEAPINGGKKLSELTKEERAIDRAARAKLSSELGHSRISIVKIYCG